MKLKILKTLIITLVISFLISCADSNSANRPTEETAIPVSAYTITKKQIKTTDKYPGKVIALKEVELRAEVGGYITKIFIEDGQKVKKGEPLYEIDRRTYQSAYQSANASLEMAKANYSKAKKDAERYSNLATKEAIAQQRVDYALTDLANAKSQVLAAQANSDIAATNLERSVIKSPLTGTIGISQVKLGSLVSPGSTLLNTVSTNDPIAVDIAINQNDYAHFYALQQAESLKDTDSNFSIEQNNDTYHVTGKIVAIDRAAIPGTGTIKVRIGFDNSSNLLLPGMTSKIIVQNNIKEAQVIIPHKAVFEQLGKYSVYVINKENKAEQRIVKLGRSLQDEIIIEEGLHEGELIVIDGLINVRPGALVNTDSDDTSTKIGKRD